MQVYCNGVQVPLDTLERYGNWSRDTDGGSRVGRSVWGVLELWPCTELPVLDMGKERLDYEQLGKAGPTLVWLTERLDFYLQALLYWDDPVKAQRKSTGPRRNFLMAARAAALGRMSAHTVHAAEQEIKQKQASKQAQTPTEQDLLACGVRGARARKVSLYEPGSAQYVTAVARNKSKRTTAAPKRKADSEDKRKLEAEHQEAVKRYKSEIAAEKAKLEAEHQAAVKRYNCEFEGEKAMRLAAEALARNSEKILQGEQLQRLAAEERARNAEIASKNLKIQLLEAQNQRRMLETQLKQLLAQQQRPQPQAERAASHQQKQSRNATTVTDDELWASLPESARVRTLSGLSVWMLVVSIDITQHASATQCWLAHANSNCQLLMSQLALESEGYESPKDLLAAPPTKDDFAEIRYPTSLTANEGRFAGKVGMTLKDRKVVEKLLRSLEERRHQSIAS
eukprot:SAG31_NODE_287_length_18430_cov_8.127544_20_plen_454_part_00